MRGTSTSRVAQIGSRTRGFVEAMKLAGARADEIAMVLFAVIDELSKEESARRHKRYGNESEAT